MISPKGASGRALLKPQYFKIPVNLYQPGDRIEADIYFLYQGSHLLYRLKNLTWKQEDVSQLEKFEVDSLYVKCISSQDHCRFLESRLQRIMDETLISGEEKGEIIYSVATSLLEELFDTPQSPEKLKRSATTIQHSIDYLNKDKSHFFNLMSFATSHFSEFSHGLHTAAYSIALAKQLGFKSFNELSPLGMAAILHDIGKTKVDKDILNKADALTSDERHLVEKHPEYGYDIVRSTRLFPSITEKIILEHHEKNDGSGYPAKLCGQLSIFSQIVSLADCFDLLTSDRSYKKALKPVEAIEMLRTELKDQYNQDLVNHFIAMLRK